MLEIPDLNGVVSLANKVMEHLVPSLRDSYPLITVISQDYFEASCVKNVLMARCDKRFAFQSMGYMDLLDMTQLRGRTRAMVVITDRLSIGTTQFRSLDMSLLTVAATIASYNDEEFSPGTNGLIVDMEGKPFFSLKRRK